MVEKNEGNEGKKLFFMAIGDSENKPVQLKELTYFLLCTPDTNATQKIVNDTLKNHSDKYLHHSTFTTSPSMRFNPKTNSYEQKGTFFVVELWLANKEG